jgi:hypothetical protein
MARIGIEEGPYQEALDLAIYKPSKGPYPLYT